MWPDAFEPWFLFLELDTQWRTGINGRTGLDYLALRALLEEHGIEGDNRRRLWAEVRWCERWALVGMSGQKPDDEDLQ